MVNPFDGNKMHFDSNYDMYFDEELLKNCYQGLNQQ